MDDDYLREIREGLEMLSGPAIEIERTETTTLSDNGDWGKQARIWLKLGKPFIGMLKTVRNADLSVFICIALHVNENDEAWPSIGTIHKWTGYSRRQVQISIAALEDLNLITIVKRPGTSSVYAIPDYVKYGKGTPTYGGSNGNTPRGVQPTSPPGVQPTSPKEEPIKKKKTFSDASAPEDPAKRNEAVAWLVPFFERISGIPFVEPGGDKEKRAAAARWWNPLWRFYKATDKTMPLTLQVVRKAIETQRDEGLDISAPQSVEKKFMSVLGEMRSRRVSDEFVRVIR